MNFKDIEIVLSIIAYIFGVYYFRQHRYTISVLFFVFAGFLLRFYCASDPLVHQWDERFHALVAKNMLDNPFVPKLYAQAILPFDYKYWYENEIWLHKQPLPLWTMAMSLKIFGINALAIRLPSILLSSLAIWLVFLVGRMLYAEKIGAIAALFCSINGLVIELSAGRVATEHIDVFFFVLVLISVYYVLKNKISQKRYFLVVAGIFCGLAILTKWLPALIILPIYVVLNFKNKTKRTILFDLSLIIIAAIIIALPWQLYAYNYFTKEYLWSQHFNYLHFTEGLDGHGQAWWYFLDKIRITVNEFIYFALILLIYYNIKNRLRANDFIIALWIFIPLFVFSVAKTKMQGYLLFSFPAYFICLALFIDFILNNIHKRISYIIITLPFILAFRFGIERIKPFKNQTTENAVLSALQNLNVPEKSVIFNSPCAIEMMFYAPCTAYRGLPDSAKIASLIAQKYTVFCFDNGKIPQEIKAIQGLNMLKMPEITRFYGD